MGVLVAVQTCSGNPISSGRGSGVLDLELEEVGWGQDLGLDLIQPELAAQRNTSWPRVAA